MLTRPRMVLMTLNVLSSPELSWPVRQSSDTRDSWLSRTESEEELLGMGRNMSESSSDTFLTEMLRELCRHSVNSYSRAWVVLSQIVEQQSAMLSSMLADGLDGTGVRPKLQHGTFLVLYFPA